MAAIIMKTMKQPWQNIATSFDRVFDEQIWKDSQENFSHLESPISASISCHFVAIELFWCLLVAPEASMNLLKIFEMKIFDQKSDYFMKY